MAVRYATEFGLTGDGVTNDTTAMQSAISALSARDTLLLTPGAVYLVDADSITLPFLSYSTVQDATAIVGPATIKARTAGTFLVAHSRWVTATANTNAGSPWRFHEIAFDANDLASYAFVDFAYANHFVGCGFNHATVVNCLFTRLTQDAQEAGSYLAGNIWQRCSFRSGTATSTALFQSTGPAGTANGPTDAYILSSDFNGRGIAPYCIDLQTAAGWTIADNQAFSSAAGASSDLRIRNLGRVSAIHGNTFEEGALIEKVGGRQGRIGPANSWRSDVTVQFTADSSSEDLTFVGDHFGQNQSASANARLIHDSNQSNKTLHAIACTAEDSAPFVENYPTTFPRIRHRSCVANNRSGWLHDLPDNVPTLVEMLNLTGTGPELAEWRTDAPSGAISLVHDGVATNENLGFLQWRDTAGNFYARIGTFAVDVTPGAAEGRIYLYTWDAGTQTEQLRLGDGAMVGASATGGLKGRGTLNAEAGVYINGIPITSGTGSPEGAVTAPVGSLFLRTDGGASTTLYVKQSGSGNTGWAAK